MVSPSRASKTRSNRPGWSVTFRHPMRTDSRGQRGLKIRRGLGTADDAEADRLVAQLNELLEDESWWSGDRRAEAERKFSPVVVSTFFDGIEAGSVDSQGRRTQVIPLPSREDGYSHILFLGTTGAGKTTLLRHVIGSDPIEDRFPSTSTAKTTTADIEIITAPGSFRAAVTFMPEHEVRAHIEECLEEACLEAVQTHSDAKIMGAFLQHREQRFRLSYVLGSWTERSEADDSEFAFEDEEELEAEIDAGEIVGPEERSRNSARLREYHGRIKALAAEVEKGVTEVLGPLHDQKTADDRAAWLELFGNEAFTRKEFSEIALDVMDEISDRFSILSAGALDRGTSGWPILWSYENEERGDFLSHVRWFSSNHHKQFGRLLTPLVDGIRVQGPLYPSAAELNKAGKLVLLDGQGLGHTATTASSVSTRISQRFDSVDMILLVDNAQQPMQAAPLALLRAVGSAGFADKLAIAFTHFDQVKGANLGSFEQKREHVAASVANAIASLRDIVGAGVAGALDRQIEHQSVFLGGLDRPTEKIPVGYQRELGRLIEVMQRAAAPAEPIEIAPQYEFKGLEIAMHDAIDAFRDPWRARLGLAYHDAVAKEHWTRVKALSRRLANGWADEYDNLTPVADLLARLQEEASKWLDRPAGWTRPPKDEDEREAALDVIRRAVFARLYELTRRRLRDDQVATWRVAYDHSGTGSATRRAKTIDDIHGTAAPNISAAMSQDAREFLTRLYVILREAIEEAGGIVLPVAA
ncbi:hypothetical protein ACVINW_002170 [Bradyrhizobium sp. USDA 4461]